MVPKRPKRSPYVPRGGSCGRAWDELADATEALIAAELARDRAADHAREEGLSWGEIAQAAGMTRQAAWQRFRSL